MCFYAFTYITYFSTMNISCKIVFFLFCMIFLLGDMQAQSFVFGIKGGPTLGLQRWNNYQNNDPLFAYHGVLFIETADDPEAGSLFAEAGYHVKGRAIRFRASVNPNTGIAYDAEQFQMRFNNVSLSLGGKNRFNVGRTLGFYSIAIRGEYNISHDLQLYQGFTDGVQKFVYGLTLGGGFEFPFSEYVGGMLDIRFSPDISRQIFIPASRYNNPFTGTQEIFNEQSIKNVAFEVSLGIRFLRKVIYVD